MLKTQAWKASYYVKDKIPGVSSSEYYGPCLLGISLRVSQCMGNAPVRLRWSRGKWLLELSQYLVVFQRLLVTLSSITIYIGVGYDLMSNIPVRVGTSTFTAALWITEMSLVVLVCILRAITAPRHIDHLIVQLKQMNKIHNGLNHGTSTVTCPKFRKLMLFLYIVWVASVHINDYVWFQVNTENHLVSTLYACFYYQSMSVKIIKLQMAIVITEISSVITALNDHLERLLQSISQNSDDAVNSKYGYLTIRQLAQYYEQIGEVVREVDEDSGPILLLLFMLVFLELLISPYNLISGIVMEKDRIFILQQTCWTLIHYTSLLLIIEPCQWMQNQLDRTRYLLSRLARRTADSDERFFKELYLFIMQVQTGGVAISPMGVFTLSRALLASVIGGVTTYLAIIIQMHKVSEML